MRPARPARRVSSWRSGLVALLLIPLVAALAACGAPTQTPPAVWSTSFDDGTGWVLSSDAVAEVGVTDGRLQVHVFSPGQLAWASSESTWQDCRVIVSAMQVSGPVDNEYGILLRMDDDKSFYAFSVSGDGYVRIAHYADEVWSLLGADWSPSDAVNQGLATNVLEVVAQGTELEFLVNGETVAKSGDSEVTSGPIGLYAGAFSEGDVVVAFDDLSVTSAP